MREVDRLSAGMNIKTKILDKAHGEHSLAFVKQKTAKLGNITTHSF